MKALNRHSVPDRSYYYLLDWKDSNMEEFIKVTSKESVGSLTKDEFWKAFDYAVEFDKQLSNDTK